MAYNGVIARKIETIQERLRKLRGLGKLSTARLDSDYFLKSGIERTLQVCVEAVIDIAERILSLKGMSPVTTSLDALKNLQDLGVIADAGRYADMVKFRNLIVHRYESVDNATLVAICERHLPDFERFIAEIEGASP